MKFVLLLSSLLFAVRAADENPLGRVVGLLNDLKAKVTSDSEAEAKSYKEFVEWCDGASADTQNDIKTLSTNQEKLEARITELGANIEADTSKVEELAGELASTASELKDATAVHDKETADFQASEKELVEVVGTLDRAISVLEREMQKNPAALNQINSRASNAQSLLQSLTAVADAAAFEGADRTALLGLAQIRQNADADDAEAGAPAAATYKTHSTSIFDLLEDLKEKAEGELSDLRKAAANAKHNFEMLKQSLEDQTDADNADLKETKASKASASENKGAAEGDLGKTVKSLATAKQSLETANSNCMTVAADHEATTAARAAELKVIAEATQIIKDTSSGAVEQSYSFVQIKMNTRVDLANSEVVTLVKNLADKQHSSALAQLASRIQAMIKFGSGDDVFKKVRGLIKDMIEKLESEAGADAKEKAYCDEETSKSNTKNAELTATIDKLTSKIDVAAARSTDLKGEVKELQAQLAKLANTQSEMNKIRQEQNADYTKAKKDLELGLSGVRAALTKLRDYYGSASFIQDKPLAELMQQPAMPEHHGKATGAGQSIIGILEVCESDFATDLSKEETAEADAADAYDKMTQQNEVEKTTKTQDVKYKTQEFKGLDKDIGDLSNDRGSTSEERSAVQEYLGKLNDRCVAKPETYESRKARRESEINGLKEALNILEEVGSSFVQRKNRGSLRGALKP